MLNIRQSMTGNLPILVLHFLSLHGQKGMKFEAVGIFTKEIKI